jgi:hypothetical protein
MFSTEGGFDHVPYARIDIRSDSRLPRRGHRVALAGDVHHVGADSGVARRRDGFAAAICAAHGLSRQQL